MSGVINKNKSTKNLEIAPKINTKKKTIDLIKEFLSSQPDQIKKLEKVSQTLSEVINNFIEITQNYSNQLEILALKLIPNYSTEGQIAQAVQGILLFYSEGLNNLVISLKEANIQKNEEETNNLINTFNEYKSSYFSKVREAILNSEKYKKEIELYQEYLINKEYNEHMSRGDIKNTDDEIIINKKEKKLNDNKDKKEEIEEEKTNKNNLAKGNNNNEIYNKNEINNSEFYDPFNDIILNVIDNEKEVIESHKMFISKVNESNDILNKIKIFLSEEKTSIRNNIFRLSNCLIEGLLECAKNQKNNYEIQFNVIKNLIKILKYEETNKNFIRPAPVKLKYLEIYHNYIQDKNDLNNTKKINLTTDDLHKTNIPNFSKKTYTLNYQDINTDFISRNTISFNQINNKSKKELMFEKLKSMVIKLNRDEIIKIFEKIKSTNVLLSEVDVKIIEQEVNYKIIHDILINIFLYKDKYTEKEKNTLTELIAKDRKYIYYFIKVLNEHRTKGNFIISEFTLNYLGEIFKYINNLVLNKNDMELFKFIFILSMTYYHLSKDNIKIYLFSYIKDHPDYQKVKFWDDYLQEMINHDLKGDIDNKNIKNLNKEEKEKLINSYFSNFITVIKAMADFRMNKKFVRDFVEKNKDKYFLSKEHIKSVCMIFDVSLNENEVSYNGDILNKEIKNLKNDNKDLNKHNYEELVANDNNNNNEEVNKEININQNINEINKINIEKKNEDEKYLKIEENEKKKKIDENKNNDIILNKNNVIIEEDKKYENYSQTNNEKL